MSLLPFQAFESLRADHRELKTILEMHSGLLMKHREQAELLDRYHEELERLNGSIDNLAHRMEQMSVDPGERYSPAYKALEDEHSDLENSRLMLNLDWDSRNVRANELSAGEIELGRRCAAWSAKAREGPILSLTDHGTVPPPAAAIDRAAAALSALAERVEAWESLAQGFLPESADPGLPEQLGPLRGRIWATQLLHDVALAAAAAAPPGHAAQGPDKRRPAILDAFWRVLNARVAAALCPALAVHLAAAAPVRHAAAAGVENLANEFQPGWEPGSSQQIFSGSQGSLPGNFQDSFSGQRGGFGWDGASSQESGFPQGWTSQESGDPRRGSVPGTPDVQNAPLERFPGSQSQPEAAPWVGPSQALNAGMEGLPDFLTPEVRFSACTLTGIITADDIALTKACTNLPNFSWII